MNVLYALLSGAALVAVVAYALFVAVRARRLPRYHWALAAALVCALPLVLAAVSSAVGGALGCTVNEAGTSPCVVLGTDIGEALATLFMMGWLMVLTIWGVGLFGVMAFVGFTRHRASR